MSVYVGIDVHRKRSQVAVAGEDGRVQLNRNVVNGSQPMLGLLGGLPPGTPVAFEAAFGWGWLTGLLEDYGFEAHLVHPLRCKAIASARLKNDKVDAAISAQLLRADLLPEAWLAPPEVRARCGRCCVTAFSWCGCAPCWATGSTPSPPATAITAAPGTGAARAGPGSPPWTCRQPPAG
jgi:hypothetical protein